MKNERIFFTEMIENGNKNGYLLLMPISSSFYIFLGCVPLRENMGWGY